VVGLGVEPTLILYVAARLVLEVLGLYDLNRGYGLSNGLVEGLVRSEETYRELCSTALRPP